MKSVFNWVSTTYRKWVVQSKKSRLLKLYEKKDYADLASLFASEKDYSAVTFDEFPFLYFMISTPAPTQAKATRRPSAASSKRCLSRTTWSSTITTR